MKKCFLQIYINKDHCDFLRMTCYGNLFDQNLTIKFARLVFGLTSIPFVILNKTIRKHLKEHI